MLVETKVKSEMIVDNKVRKVTETFILDTTFFSTAEYSVTEMLEKEKEAGTLKDYEIQSLRISPIKEIANQYHGEHSYLATLKDIWTDDDVQRSILNTKSFFGQMTFKRLLPILMRWRRKAMRCW